MGGAGKESILGLVLFLQRYEEEWRNAALNVLSGFGKTVQILASLKPRTTVERRMQRTASGQCRCDNPLPVLWHSPGHKSCARRLLGTEYKVRFATRVCNQLARELAAEATESGDQLIMANVPDRLTHLVHSDCNPA